MNKNFIIAGAVVLVLGLAIAIGVTLSSEPVAAGLPEGEISVVGDSLPQYAGENDDNVALGLAAPTFSAPDQNSEIFQLEKNGNSKALLFLAHWCGYCQQEVPVVQRFIDSNGVPPGIDVIAVATSIDRGRDNYPPQEWLEREGWSETQIYDLDREIGEAYGLNAFPYWVFLDKDLNVLARRTGNLPEDMVGALLIQLANQ
ncbi:MAG: TlpA family protein disulfide reductase [Candidatus Actinomarina sp.]|uniref:MedDCM-OCT-S36-C22-cds12 n=1 Tax=Candidatus Actinomarina minuta TaxID=1389454 RepID=S5DWT2_9ACTN|nr:MedDCM-OCT-S36-C22-cds12 [Candidatus Actinomarina minuta]AGQ19971.1 MedDCM-OCT-S44-C50-cds31 [Candidatus Actinomarina minuta]